MAEQNKPNKDGVTINPVVAAVTGAIVGGVAVAGAMALGDDKNRQKIKGAVSDAKDRTKDYVENVKQVAIDKKDELVENMEEAKKEALEKAEDIKKVITEE